MKKRIVISIILLSFTSLVACGDNSNVEPTIITGEQAKEMVNSNMAVLLDVRSREEFESYHIGGSVLIPVDELEYRISDLPTSKSVPIIVYCKSGMRSTLAADILITQGFTNVYDMQSIDNWSDIKERDIFSEIDRLANLIEILIFANEGVYLDFDNGFIAPEGASVCGRCTGCGERHLLWDDDFFIHDHHDCDDCEYEYGSEECFECEHYHIHDEHCDHD